jgi:hypothetical protein
MIGFDKSYVYPTMIISCQSPIILRKNIRAILEFDFLYEHKFKLKDLLQYDLKLLITKNRYQIRLNGINRGNEFSIPRNLYGAEITICGSKKLTIIEDVITVTGIVHRSDISMHIPA